MLVDLSVALDRYTPVFPGDSPIEIVQGGSVEDDGYLDHRLSLPTHIGTHIDAPSHMIEGGKDLGDFPLEAFRGRGVCIDARKGFRKEDVERANLGAGDIVLFWTGMAERYGDDGYFTDHPELPREIALQLVEHKVAMAGFDSASPDRPPYPIHKILLEADILIIENLARLDALFGKTFQVQAFPLKVSLDGAPARVIADVA